MGSGAIPEILDLLESRFDPVILDQIKARKGGGGEYVARPLDVLLATNMISVGVDVPRLGLMVVAGQPKTTAEYIQATSRVGRKHPGLVCTVFNWARPRDLSHYETFEHYHSTFYKHVEALSVTPFSAGATSRGLAALLVSMVRQPGFEFNSNDKAMLMATQRGHQYVTDAIEAITRRAELIAGVEAAEEVRQQLKRKMDLWQKRAQRTAQGNQLGYETKKDGVTIGLLRKPSIEPWDEFTCLNSLRDVEPTANLILDDFGMDDDGGEDAGRRSRPMNNKDSKRCKVGELRPSQALTTFGIGSIIDLPNLSVMVMGLEDWPLKDTVEIGEAAAPGFGEGSAGATGEVVAVGSRSCRTHIRSTSSMPRHWSASRSPRFLGGWSARTVGGWPRWVAVCSSWKRRTARTRFVTSTPTARNPASRQPSCLPVSSWPARTGISMTFPGGSSSIMARRTARVG